MLCFEIYIFLFFFYIISLVCHLGVVQLEGRIWSLNCGFGLGKGWLVSF